jgi:hypothetical protein
MMRLRARFGTLMTCRRRRADHARAQRDLRACGGLRIAVPCDGEQTVRVGIEDQQDRRWVVEQVLERLQRDARGLIPL